MNLIDDPWIPIIRDHTGKRERIRPWELRSGKVQDPVSRIDAPRADFNDALMQFLIGLVQTVMTPKDEEEWQELFLNPPSTEALQDLMKPHSKYFNLFGDGPRFMQDLELEEKGDVDIASLFIDSPGANGIKNNTDHFIKRGRIEKTCPACTATALFTLQISAPSGGAGHRTSLRGGGPLTTLALCDEPSGKYNSLWHQVWLNVLSKKELKKTACDLSLKEKAAQLPWIVPTKGGKKEEDKVLPDEIHPFQIFWSMPRRIRLGASNLITERCDVCGERSDSFSAVYNTLPYGNNYSELIVHPLSPYYGDAKGNKLPVHPHPGGFTYRHWPMYAASVDEANPRSLNLQLLDTRLENLMERIKGFETGVHAAGYDMDNMKPRCWYEAKMPYWLIESSIRNDVIGYAERLADAASMVASNTVKAVKTAWVDPGAKGGGDLDYIKSQFWIGTESLFYQRVKEIQSSLKATGKADVDLLEDWLSQLSRESSRIFEIYAEQTPMDAGEIEGVPRVIHARRKLAISNLGKFTRKALGLSEKKLKQEEVAKV
jgi:CRISPR system Cascade subunit CasA